MTPPGTSPETLIDRMIAAKASANYQGLIDLVPYASFLGLTAAMQGDELITTMRYGDHLIGNPALPALHGGTVDYLRPGAPVDTHARGVVTRQGRRVTNVRMEAWQADRSAPVATAHAIFLVMRS
jgi:hypothetical protein